MNFERNKNENTNLIIHAVVGIGNGARKAKEMKITAEQMSVQEAKKIVLEKYPKSIVGRRFDILSGKYKLALLPHPQSAFWLLNGRSRNKLWIEYAERISAERKAVK